MLLAVARDKFRPSWDLGGEPPGDYVVTHVSNALDEQHRTDAHFVSYVMRKGGAPLARQPRLLKADLDRVRELGFEVSVELLVADVDRPKDDRVWHCDADAVAEVRRVAALLPHAGVYATRGGLRILTALIRPLTPEQAEAAIRAHLRDLEELGLVPDWHCVDWTRHMRLPHVRRDGKPYRSPAVIPPRAAVPPPAGMVAPARARRAAGAPVDVGFLPDLPHSLRELVEPLGAALAADAHVGERHKLALRLSGALLRKGVRPERLPAFVEALFRRVGVDDDGPAKAARDTARAWASRRPVDRALDDYPTLQKAVALSFGEVLAPESLTEPREAPPSPAVELDRLAEVVRHAPPGVTLIRAQCGLGKTATLRRVAIERAMKPHARPGAHTRAPVDSKTAIALPTHALVDQVAADVEREGVSVARLVGPLSVKEPDGSPTCKFHAQGEALAVGGLSVRRELCDGRGKPCQYRESCRAYEGRLGPADARIFLGPHALVGQLAEAAGGSGLLALDEPPPLLEAESFTAAELEAAKAALSFFAVAYGDAMAVVLTAARAWLDQGPTTQGALSRAWAFGCDPVLFEAAYQATGESEVEAQVRASMPPRQGGNAPPLNGENAIRLRTDGRLARHVGGAARVLRALFRATVSPADVQVSVVQVEGQGARLEVCALRDDLAGALRRDGATLVLAADVELSTAAIAKVVGYEPTLHRFAAGDGAPVERVLAVTPGATRGNWLAPFSPAAIARSLDAAVAWLVEAPAERWGLVTYPVVEAALAFALGRPMPKAYKRREEALDTLVELVRPILARAPTQPELGHFGALRGLDAWKDLDAMVTLGDPFPDVGAVERELAWIGTVDPDRAARLAGAELEQVHGRMRLVHRTKPARLYHAGRVVPTGWPSYSARETVEGRPSRPLVEVRALVEAAGGARSVAQKLGVNRATVGRWVRGEHGIPAELLGALESLSNRQTQPLTTELEPLS